MLDDKGKRFRSTGPRNPRGGLGSTARSRAGQHVRGRGEPSEPPGPWRAGGRRPGSRPSSSMRHRLARSPSRRSSTRAARASSRSCHIVLKADVPGSVEAVPEARSRSFRQAQVPVKVIHGCRGRHHRVRSTSRLLRRCRDRDRVQRPAAARTAAGAPSRRAWTFASSMHVVYDVTEDVTQAMAGLSPEELEGRRWPRPRSARLFRPAASAPSPAAGHATAKVSPQRQAPGLRRRRRLLPGKWRPQPLQGRRREVDEGLECGLPSRATPMSRRATARVLRDRREVRTDAVTNARDRPAVSRSRRPGERRRSPRSSRRTCRAVHPRSAEQGQAQRCAQRRARVAERSSARQWPR